jgi:hypothetical protein
MRLNLLCRERLQRLLSVLDRNGGSASFRDLWRSHRVWDWEIEQAAELGWVRILTRQPRIGRPSRCAQKLSETHVAKLPPFRRSIPRCISFRHERFAWETLDIMPGGCLGFKISTLVRAYVRTFPGASSRGGAAASATRLMKRRDVRVARYWFQRTSGMRLHEPMPRSVDGIITRLRELGLI